MSNEFRDISEQLPLLRGYFEKLFQISERICFVHLGMIIYIIGSSIEHRYEYDLGQLKILINHVLSTWLHDHTFQ